jgi:hypothetical protein
VSRLNEHNAQEKGQGIHASTNALVKAMVLTPDQRKPDLHVRQLLWYNFMDFVCQAAISRC